MIKKTNRKLRELIYTDEYIIVPLTRGMFAKIDKEDKHVVEGWNWCANKYRGGYTFYAGRGASNWGIRETILLHREIMKPGNGYQVDHINRDTLDNRKVNMRFATNGQNQCNKRVYKNNVSGYRGVYWHKHREKFTASIRRDGIIRSLGYFNVPEEAALAYDAAAREHYGEFASLNFPDKL